MAINLSISFVIAAIIRCLLLSSNFAKLIQNRVEVSTPLNSWKRSKCKWIGFVCCCWACHLSKFSISLQPKKVSTCSKMDLIHILVMFIMKIHWFCLHHDCWSTMRRHSFHLFSLPSIWYQHFCCIEWQRILLKKRYVY